MGKLAVYVSLTLTTQFIIYILSYYSYQFPPSQFMSTISNLNAFTLWLLGCDTDQSHTWTPTSQENVVPLSKPASDYLRQCPASSQSEAGYQPGTFCNEPVFLQWVVLQFAFVFPVLNRRPLCRAVMLLLLCTFPYLPLGEWARG
jgi:hypothetical protein